MQPLAGKVALVTGAGCGIGRATALELAGRGAAVVLACRYEGTCLPVVDAIRAAGGKAEVARCDVTCYDQVQAAVDLAVARFGRLDALVNNAGVIEPIASLTESDPDAWARNVQVNLVGAFHACRAVVPQFLKTATSGRAGVIVNLSTGGAHRPLEGWSAYNAAKAGLAMLTRSVDLELRGAGVRVFGFQPGVVNTRMQELIRASGVNEVSRIPRERLEPPSAPARVIAWLCTDEAADLAGQELSIRDPELRRRAGL